MRMERASEFIASVCLVAMFVLLLLDVSFRFAREEFYWGAELSGIMMAWLTIFGLPWVTRNRSHLSTGIATDILAPGPQKVLRYVGYGLMLFYLLVMIWYCGDLALKNVQNEARSAGILRLPLAIVQVGIGIGLVLTAISQIAVLRHEGQQRELDQ